MANPENLIPQAHKLTVEDQSKGGKASVEARRRRKAMREAFDELLRRDYVDSSGNEVQGVEVMAAKVFQKAMKGDMRAVEFIRDTVGEAPVQRVETVEIPHEVYERVADALMDD